MRIVWSDEASEDLRRIYHFQRAQGVAAAEAKELVRSLQKSTEKLAQFPLLGRKLEGYPRHAEFRRIVVGRFWIVYAVLETAIRIHTVFDARRDSSKHRF
jgi:plasmid stabilization system protein ParE